MAKSQEKKQEVIGQRSLNEDESRLVFTRRLDMEEETEDLHCDTDAANELEEFDEVIENDECCDEYVDNIIDSTDETENVNDVITGTVMRESEQLNHVIDTHDNVSAGGSQANMEYNSRQSVTAENNLLLLALKLKHKLTSSAVQDVSKLLNFVGGVDCCATSKYLFDKGFATLTSTYEIHYICKRCESYIGVVEDDILHCLNESCNDICSKRLHHDGFFMYLPLTSQLTDMFENHDVACNIVKVNQRVHDNFSDIYDGKVYRETMLFEQDYEYISLTFNCDGVPIFKSSSCCIWPILCTVNELPPTLRRKHVLLVALWFGSVKPNMNVFFEPFVTELTHLNQTGFVWKFANKNINTKVKLLLGVCDSVARPLIQNFKQFNGEYGCGFCLDAGVQTVQGLGHTRAYPYRENTRLRNHDQTNSFAEQAVATGIAVCGVKGPSILSTLPDFNIVDGIAPDYMHSVLLGVARQLSTLWFDSSNSEKPYYLGRAVKDIDTDLLSIKPPCNISRLPRTIVMRKFWKAHEWYAWLFHYSLIVLKKYLNVKFYNHLALLVEAVSILLQNTVTTEILNHCELILIQFVIDMEDLYGINNVSFNVHLCLHLTKSVENWGPLWTHSSFVFEAYNGELIEMFRGTQGVPLQVVKTFLLHRALPALSKKMVVTSTADYCSLLESFLSHSAHINYAQNIHGVTVLGQPILKQMSSEHCLALHSVCKTVTAHAVKYYKRVVVNGEIIHSAEYCKNIKRNSYTVELLSSNSLFAIDTYVVASLMGQGECCYAIGRFFDIKTSILCNNPIEKVNLSHVVAVHKELGHLVAVKAKSIKHKCIFISTPSNRLTYDYVCKQLNNVEYCK